MEFIRSSWGNKTETIKEPTTTEIYTVYSFTNVEVIYRGEAVTPEELGNITYGYCVY